MTGQTSYADSKLGVWAGGFDSEAKNRLNAVKAALDAALPGSPEEAEIIWVIDEAEKRGVCASEEADYLRNQFVHENGLPLVVGFASE